MGLPALLLQELLQHQKKMLSKWSTKPHALFYQKQEQKSKRRVTIMNNEEFMKKA